MIKFIESKEFLIVTGVLIIAWLLGQIGNLANIVQVLGLYAWGFVIWKQERHHALLKTLMEEEKDAD